MKKLRKHRTAYTRPLLYNETEAQQLDRLEAEREEEDLRHAFVCAKAYVNDKLPLHEERNNVKLDKFEISLLLMSWVALDQIRVEYRDKLVLLVCDEYLLKRE